MALMFGICFLHSITMCGHVTVWAANILLSCVNGFVFITGWYGLRFRPSKLIRLYATAFFSGVVLLAANLWLGDYVLGTDKAALKRLYGFFLDHWFLNAYAFMMLLVPLVDAAFAYLPRRVLWAVLAPFGLLAFGWSFGNDLPVLGLLLPGTAGLGSYTGLSLLATYTAARLCRMVDVGRFFTWRRALMALVVLWFCTGIGMGEYASPFAVALAATCFLVFTRVPWPGWMGRVAVFLGPSMFTVYLLHSNRLGFDLMTRLEERWADIQGWPLPMVYFSVAAIVFCVCVALDLPRRLAVWGTRGLWSPLLAWLDALWLRVFPER